MICLLFKLVQSIDIEAYFVLCDPYVNKSKINLHILFTKLSNLSQHAYIRRHFSSMFICID